MLSAIVQDEIDALIAIDQVIDLTFKNHPDKVFKSSETPMAVFGESFGIRQGDNDFLNFINTWIRFYKDNGWLKQRRDYWFGNK